ncbi:B-cell lymphoma 6 [Araneus ventricosus]|uniref:B-cell lymphoma 6 n=1 Tax=Araneus ventricosus TaxID=182803 RepID=A0A4Y2M302_ARAVE|nr:B-cell lymphoma 6 [Araneus ventricosus]
MAELVCLFCFKTYDSLIGHHCLNGWWIPGVASINTTVEAVAAEPDSLKQGSTHGTCVQINETGKVFTELANANPVFSNENYLLNQVTYGNDQKTYSSQDYNTAGTTNHKIAMDSDLCHIEEWAIGGMNNQGRNELGTKDCNMAMRLSSTNSEMASNIVRLSSTAWQLGLDEDNLSIPSILKLSINRKDFDPVSGAIDSMSTYKVTKLEVPAVFEDVQSELKIQNDPSKLMNNLVKRSHGYEINRIRNDAPVLYEDRGRINHELVMGNKPDSEAAVDSIRFSESYRQCTKYGKSMQSILMNGDLHSMANNFAVTEAEPGQELVFSNSPTNVFLERNGSINHQVRINRTNVKMMRLKCTNASTEGKIGLNDMNFMRVTEESATIGNSFTEKSDFFEDCHVDAAHALAGPSLSQLNESCTSVCLKEFQPNGNVKRHSMEWNSHLKNHMIIHKGVKEYKCDVCEKSFRQKGHLQAHVLTHTGEKPHECIICGKKFSTKGSLKNHIIIHKGIKEYKCDVCGILFRRKDYLQKHVFTHTGDKPHECIICGKKFSQKYLTKSQLSEPSENFAISEAEPCQRLIPGGISTVNPTHESAAYTGLIGNQAKLICNNVQKITGEWNTAIIAFKFVSNFTVLFRSQEETAAKGTSWTEKSELSGECSRNYDLPVAGPSRLHFNELNFAVFSNEF